jgi:hypothetical protein
MSYWARGARHVRLTLVHEPRRQGVVAVPAAPATPGAPTAPGAPAGPGTTAAGVAGCNLCASMSGLPPDPAGILIGYALANAWLHATRKYLGEGVGRNDGKRWRLRFQLRQHDERRMVRGLADASARRTCRHRDRSPCDLGSARNEQEVTLQHLRGARATQKALLPRLPNLGAFDPHWWAIVYELGTSERRVASVASEEASTRTATCILSCTAQFAIFAKKKAPVARYGHIPSQ